MLHTEQNTTEHDDGQHTTDVRCMLGTAVGRARNLKALRECWYTEKLKARGLQLLASRNSTATASRDSTGAAL